MLEAWSLVNCRTAEPWGLVIMGKQQEKIDVDLME